MCTLIIEDFSLACPDCRKGMGLPEGDMSHQFCPRHGRAWKLRNERQAERIVERRIAERLLDGFEIEEQ